jgi:hypothetical protein
MLGEVRQHIASAYRAFTVTQVSTATIRSTELIEAERWLSHSLLIQNVLVRVALQKTETLRNFEVLLNAEVEAPVGETAYNALPVIQPQNRLAELCARPRRPLQTGRFD